MVRVWHTETEPQTIKAFNDIARRFEAKNPGIKIEAEGLAWGDLEGKIMAGLASGSPPELSHGQPITCTALQSKGLLLPLDEVVDAIGKDNIWDQVKRVCNVGGKQYGLVHAAGTSLLIYRKDLADKAGLKPPKTWADLDRKRQGADAIDQGRWQDRRLRHHAAGRQPVHQHPDRRAHQGKRRRAVRQAQQAADDRQEDDRDARVLRELVKYAPPGWEGHGYLQTFQNLYGQKAAMMFLGYGRGAGMIERFAPKEMANDKTFDVWIKPHGPSGTEPAAQVDEEPWMLFKDAKNTKEAIEFLKFFYQDDNYLEYVATVPIHLFPITKSLRNSPKYQNVEMIQRWKGWIDVQQQYLDKDQGKPTLVVDWADMTDKPYLLEVLGSGILRDMVMDVLLEKKEPADGRRDADRSGSKNCSRARAIGRGEAPTRSGQSCPGEAGGRAASVRLRRARRSEPLPALRTDCE